MSGRKKNGEKKAQVKVLGIGIQAAGGHKNLKKTRHRRPRVQTEAYHTACAWRANFGVGEWKEGDGKNPKKTVVKIREPNLKKQRQTERTAKNGPLSSERRGNKGGTAKKSAIEPTNTTNKIHSESEKRHRRSCHNTRTPKKNHNMPQKQNSLNKEEHRRWVRKIRGRESTTKKGD